MRNSWYILADNDWNYRVTPGSNPHENAAIGRKSADGRSNFWKYDGANGEEIEETNGVTTRTSWFVSGGELLGKIRSIRKTDNTGKDLSTVKNYYNAEGRLTRKTVGKIVEEYLPDGRLKSSTFLDKTN